jgi:asparagine synthase (glutamine-hydrolysing)
MCGIAGYLQWKGLDPGVAPLAAMCDAIRHRGPDGHGQYVDNYVALGHRRLSIIDLAGGAQPLANEDGSVQVVFNGEIYNFLELRRELIHQGHRFRTQSDTEVLVHLYEEKGDRLPEYLNGMFAFAIWDARQKKLLLARDRFGEKPLYYSTAAGGFDFSFASEMKAMATLPGFSKQVRGESVADYLSYGYIPDPYTIYEGVRRLRPAHRLIVTPSGIREERYWTPPFRSERQIPLEDAVAQIREIASDAVRRRLVSDVPLGAFLSGGIDSSAVVALMSQAASDPARTFSIGFTSREFDEVRYASLVAERYQTQHYEQIVSPSIGEMLGVAVEHFDEPFADGSAIPTLYVSRLTRQHVTVALSGDGADELFGGYRRYWHGVAESKVRQMMPEWFRATVFRSGANLYPALNFAPRAFRARTVLRNISASLADAYFNAVTCFRDASLDRILAPELRRRLDGYSPRADWARRFEGVSHLSPLQQMQSVDFETYLPADILVKVDRATMAYSLESRAPWLDHRLAELACGMPQSMHVSLSGGKLAFKRAMRDLLPEQILSRSKMGFAVPLHRWFQTTLRQPFEAMVFRPEIEQYVDLVEVRRLWAEQSSGRGRHEQKLWSLFMLANWEAVHCGGAVAEEVAQAVAV